MKLSQVLSVVNQVEKSKFITSIDRICNGAVESDKTLAKAVDNIDGQIKNASSGEIKLLFDAVKDIFRREVREQFFLSSAQISLLVKILTRDGNCVARISWVERLYAREWKAIDELSKELKETIKVAESGNLNDIGYRLSIYKSCMEEAYKNDMRKGREQRVSDDERSVLNVLAHKLNISSDESSAIEHLVDPISKANVLDALNLLREMGVIFISRKRQEVFVPDEMVQILDDIQGKELPEKYSLRILRTLTDAELSNVLKSHNRRIRNVTRTDKIKQILNLGVQCSSLLGKDIYSDNESINGKKERLKQLMSDLDIETSKLGTTLEERISLIASALKDTSDKEFEKLSASGYKELLGLLDSNIDNFIQDLKLSYELEENDVIDIDKLRALSISPYDVLYLASNEDIKKIKEGLGITKRGDARKLILESFASATDKLVDNYELLARRDIYGLKEIGIDISEAEIGAKFEEVTKAIFEELDLSVDEDVRKQINTSKDKVDIIISLSDDDIIIGEAKTCKDGDFAHYSTTSRQVKAYVKRATSVGKRVAQVLIVAPSFSSDFVESAEMDTEINISLLEAAGLKAILEAFRKKKHPNFSVNLFTKGGLLKSALIAKNI